MQLSDKPIQHLADKMLDDHFKFKKFDAQASELTGYSNYSYWRSTIQMFFKNRIAAVLVGVMVFISLFVIIQPYLPAQNSPSQIFINPETGRQYIYVQPNSQFWFGTNSIGQDMWARIWSGTRTSLIIAFIVGAVDSIIGITIGAIWGYVRRLDGIITQTYNVINNIPTTIVLVLATYIMRPNITTMIIAMCLTGWLGTARFVRNQIVIYRDREFNLASRCLGTPTHRVIIKNMLPQLVSVIMLRLAMSVPGAISSEVFLTYIGLGLPTQIPSLGNLINEGRQVITVESLRYMLIFPAAVLSVITISFYVIGNAFSDAADPRNHV